MVVGMAKRYQPSELIGEQGGVQTFSGRDAMNGLPVRVYSFVGEPTLSEGELKSDFIPPILSSSFTGLAGEVVSAFSDEFGKLRGAVAPGLVELLLKQTAAALDDAAKAGVVHGDLSPERIFFDREGGAGGRFVLEGYGVPWKVHPSEFSAPERIGGASFAGDIFSWARTVKHLSGPLPGDLRDLLDRCLHADPAARPPAREVRTALERHPFGSSALKPNRQAHRDTSAFERYAEGGRAENQGEGEDPSLEALSDLEVPSKTLKLQGYRQQAGAPKIQAVTQPTVRPTVQPMTQPKAQPLETDSSSGVPVSSAPTTGVLPVARVSETRPNSDSLRRLDATEAYKARLAVYNAQRSGAAIQPPVTEPVTRPAESVGRVPAAKPSAPKDADSAAATSATKFTPPPRVRVQRISETAETAQTGNGQPKSERQGEPDFEVIDDIDDRAPDPTLYRGGRRVFLLTLLGIALLVLAALQLINA